MKRYKFSRHKLSLRRGLYLSVLAYISNEPLLPASECVPLLSDAAGFPFTE